MAATTNPADVRRAAMDLLARREHSVEQLRQKLARRFGRDPELDQVIVEQLDRLVDEGLLSDSRFAAAMLRQLVLKGLGPRRLDGELRQRGIDQGWQVCAEAAELDIDWFEQARVVYSKKFPRPIPDGDSEPRRKEWAKRARFMQYRGFEADQFMHLLEAS